MNDYTYQVLDPKDVYVDNGTGQSIGYTQTSTSTVSTSSSPSISTTNPNAYTYFTKKGVYSLGSQPNFMTGFRSGTNTLVQKVKQKHKDNILERMIDSLYA